MNGLHITRKNNNTEILTKIINSVASKYNCRLKFDASTESIQFTGDETLKPMLIEKTMGIFNWG